MSTRIRRMITLLLAVVLLLQGVAVPAAGQRALPGDSPSSGAAVISPDTLYSISGRVVDGSGNGVAGGTVTVTSADAKYPIVFLPGVMGTLLRNDVQSGGGCDANRGGRIWIEWEKLGALQPLYLNDQGDGPVDGCDVIQPDGRMNTRLTIPVFGERDVKPYEQFIEQATLAGFPVLNYPGYDWRLSLTDAVAKLDTFIDANVGAGGKVFLVAHSMGGLLARAYVADATRANKIAGVVTVGTPYLGAPELAKAVASGKPGTPVDFRLNSDQIRILARSAPGIQQLLPSAAYFTGLTAGYYQPVTGATLDTYQKTADYFVQQNYVRDNVLSMADTFHVGLDGFNNNFYAQGRYTVLYAQNRYTPSSVRERRCWFGGNLCIDVDRRLLGDGSVPVGSSDLRRLSADSRLGVTLCGFTGSERDYKEHGYLFLDERVIADVLHVLKGEPTVNCSSPSSLRAAAAPTGFREFTVWGEGRVIVVDAQGNFTGVDESGFLVRDLVDVTYMLTDGGAILTMPSDAPYELVIYQTGSQPMQVVSSDFGLLPGRAAGDEEYAAQAQAIFDNVPAAAGGVATVTVASAPLAQLTLAVDTDANGTPEATIPPGAVLDDPAQVQDTTMPTTTLTIQGPQNNEGAYTGPVTVTLAAVDDNSGVLRSYLSLDNGQTWQEYSAPVEVQPGQATAVQAYTVDKAGNQEYPPQERTLTFAGASSLYLPVVTRGGQQVETELLQEAQFLAPPQAEFLSETRLVAATVTYTATTSADGRYTIANLPSGTYDVMAVRTGWNITPAKITVTLPENATTVNFTATTIGNDPAEEVLIPAGPFLMGCDSTNPAESCRSEEQPLHTVTLSAYAIDKYEVTNARYQACVADGGCTAPHQSSSYTRPAYHGNPTYNDYPVINVDWHQATAFCAWAGKRLPTEAEWEKAARGGIDTRKYPWGDAAADCTKVNYWGFGGCVGDTSQVGSYAAGASLYGVMDMAGNVTEWVNDWYDPGYYSQSLDSTDPTGPATGTYRVQRGGSWGSVDNNVRSARRVDNLSGHWNSYGGFRCVRSQ